MADFRTETQKISDSLRDAIIRGEFRSGERLPQRKIAEKYNSTTIVVREALRLLENEHLVCIEPRFGAMVREITPKILKERYIVREALEGMAARLAAANMTIAFKERLYTIAAECDSKLISDAIDYHEKAELHRRFHIILLDMTECEELNRLLSNIYLNTVILSNAYHVDWSTDVPNTHTRLVDVLVQGDPDKAEQAMRQHVRNGLEMELQSLMRIREN